MRRMGASGTCGLFLAWAALAGAQEGLPPLSAPVEIEPPPAPRAELSTVLEEAPTARSPAASGAVLAVPGLVLPGAPAPVPRHPLPEAAPPPTAPALPPLVGPADLNGAAPGPRAPGMSVSGGSPALSLETVPPGTLPELGATRPATPPRTASARPDPGSARPANPPPPPAPARRSRFFGRFLPGPPAAPPAPRGRESITVEPRDDPATDAAIKRRVEAQIRQALAGHLRSLEVRVRDGEVDVRARVARFWQKRSVRRTLEALPALSGYRSRIEVTD